MLSVPADIGAAEWSVPRSCIAGADQGRQRDRPAQVGDRLHWQSDRNTATLKFNLNFQLNFRKVAAMKRVTMLEFRKNALQIVKGVQQGQPVMLTYRGEPVARLEPPESAPQTDPFYTLADLADGSGKSLTNQQIDETLYGG